MRPPLVIPLLFACLAGSSVGAQLLDTSWCEIVSSAQLSSDDQEKVTALLSEALEAVASGEAEAVDASRERVLDVLACPTLSVAFRNFLADQAHAELSALSGHENAHRAISAIAVAGASGSTLLEERVLRSSLEDERSAVRFSAALAYGKLLSRLGNDLVEQQRNEAERLMSSVVRPAISGETEPPVVAALVRSLLSASNREDLSVGESALRAAADGLAERIKAVRDGLDDLSENDRRAWAASLAEALDQLRGPLLNPNILSRLSDGTRVRVAHAAGQGLSLVGRLLQHDLDEQAAEDVRVMVNSSEVILTFVSREMGASVSSAAMGLEAAYTKALEEGPGVFVQSAFEWIGPQGMLVRPPFGLDAADF